MILITRVRVDASKSSFHHLTLPSILLRESNNRSGSSGGDRMNQDRERLPRTRRPLKPAQPRPRLNHVEALRIVEAIDCSDVSGVQTCALVSLMFYNNLRLGQALDLKCGDVHLQGPHPSLLISMQRMPSIEKTSSQCPALHRLCERWLVISRKQILLPTWRAHCLGLSTERPVKSQVHHCP